MQSASPMEKLDIKILFVTVGSIRHNASIIRAVHLGNELQRKGVGVGILLLDCSANRQYLADCGYAGRILWTKKKLFIEKHVLHAINTGGYSYIHSINANLRVALLYMFRLVKPLLISDWDEMLSSNNNPLFRKLLYNTTEYIHLHYAGFIVTASVELQTLVLRKTEKNVYYLPYAMRGHATTAPSTNEKFRLLYLGSFSHLYANDIVELLNLSLIAVQQEGELHILGEGAMLQRLRDGLTDAAISRVFFHGYVTQDRVDEIINGLGISTCFLPLENTDSNRYRCPNKLFHYMKTNRPIVTCAVGEAFNILKDSGIYYDYGDRESLSAAVERSKTWMTVYNRAAHTLQARADEYIQIVNKFEANRKRQPILKE